jgi:hypothetical protein
LTRVNPAWTVIPKLKSATGWHAARGVAVRIGGAGTHCVQEGNTMRITIHLNTFDRIDPTSYAILWLDDESLMWSREAHMSLPLPQWGNVRLNAESTLLCALHDGWPRCVLQGLQLRQHGGPFEGETGCALWYEDDGSLAKVGSWHIQCVDDTSTRAESSVFADEIDR